MKRKFNITGLCNPQLHYMADISSKIDKIMELIDDREYFQNSLKRQLTEKQSQ